jgi:hypothetical protein
MGIYFCPGAPLGPRVPAHLLIELGQDRGSVHQDGMSALVVTRLACPEGSRPLEVRPCRPEVTNRRT